MTLDHMQRNTPCELGEQLGKQLVKFFGESPDCCATCAFRLGSFPNRCLTTTSDAFKCVIENVDFMCHDGLRPGDEPWKLCAGFIQACNKIGDSECPRTWPAQFSDELTT